MAEMPASQSRSFRLDAPCEIVFPLFTPLGERAWVPDWNPEILTGEKARGTVFRTRSHDEETIWIVSSFEPERFRVSYARLKHASNFGLVDVECRATGAGSEVSVRYTLTGISPDGEAFVREFLDPANYDRFIELWRQAISAVLAKPHPESH